jgi:hypothetical protein
MEVNNPNTGTNIQSQLILSSDGTGGSVGGITWASQNVTGSEKRLAFIGNIFETSNAARLAFYTRNESGILCEKVTILGNGNVGIGTATPNTPLSFPPVLGKKITLYPGATGDAGMAIQGNLLQIYSDNPSADIAFGYDQGGTMTERMRITANGNVGIGTSAPAASLEVNGYAKLGTDAPSIKVKKLTGTKAATEGGTVAITHGLSASKILSVSVLVSSDGYLFPPHYPSPGYNFYWDETQGYIVVINAFGGSAAILSKPIRILITYEE